MADYKIKPGDTLSAIARKNGTTVNAIAQANGIKNPNLIYAGSTLTIPDKPQSSNSGSTTTTTTPAQKTNTGSSQQNSISGASGAPNKNAAANISSASTSTPTYTESNPPPGSLRDWAAQNNVNVGYQNGNVTLASPTTGQTVSFNNDQGENYGIGDTVNGFHQVANSDALKNALGLVTNQGAASQDNKVDPETALTQKILEALDNMSKNQPNPVSTFNQMMEMYKPYMPQPVPTLSWSDAIARATNSLNPVYDERMSSINKTMDYNNLQSGFFGQLPGEALKRETAVNEEQGRVQAINQLANDLVGQSESAALQKQSLAQNQASQILGVIQQALSSATNASQQNLSNMLSVAGLLGNQSSQKYNEQIMSREMSLKEAESKLNELVQKGQLSLAERDQLLKEKESSFNQYMASSKFEWQKFLDNKSISLEEAQQQLDEEIRRGSLSVDQASQLLAEKKFDWESKKPGNEVDEATYAANYSEAYAKFAQMDAQTAVNDLLAHTSYYTGQLGPNYYNKLLKEMENKLNDGDLKEPQ